MTGGLLGLCLGRQAERNLFAVLAGAWYLALVPVLRIRSRGRRTVSALAGRGRAVAAAAGHVDEFYEMMEVCSWLWYVGLEDKSLE